MANYALKFFKTWFPRKEHSIFPEIKSIFAFLCEAGELDFSLGVSAFLYFVLLCLRQQQNSQERCDEDVLSTWKNDAVCCMSSWPVREKENQLSALELRGWKVAVSITEPLCVLWSSLSLSWKWWCLHVRHSMQCFIGPGFVGSLGCSCSWTPKTLQVFNGSAGRFFAIVCWYFCL